MRVQRSLDQVMKEYDGRIRLVFKDFPLPFHDLAMPAHEAARCAGAQGRYWPYHDRLFERQPSFQREQLIGYAFELGLDRERFTRCLDDHLERPAVQASFAEGRALGVRSTPTFFVNGTPLVGAQPVEAFREAIEDALKRAPR
jgi:protein-disulfide isomerase